MKSLMRTIKFGVLISDDAIVLIRILFVYALIFHLGPSLLKELIITDLNRPIQNIVPIPYGPDERYLPLNDVSYNFDSVKKPFGKINLAKVGYLEKHKLEDLILSSLDLEIRKRLRPHLTETLEISEKYGLDPYWVLAIMWTESHYLHTVKSPKNAHGLMQLLPSTARTLFGVHTDQLLDPSKNIELGVLYLQKLLSLYSHDYHIATVAYNQGPGNVRRKGRKVMINNQYLIKVKTAYKTLTIKTKDYLKKKNYRFWLENNNFMERYLKKIFTLLPHEGYPRLVLEYQPKSSSNAL